MSTSSKRQVKEVKQTDEHSQQVPDAEKRLVHLLKRRTMLREQALAALEERLRILETTRQNCRGLRRRLGLSRTCCPKCRRTS